MTQGLPFSMVRRQVLVSAGSLAFAGAIPGAAVAALQPIVTIAALSKVLFHPATCEDFAACGLLAGGDPFWVQAAEELVEEHAALARRLESTGAEVLYLEDVLRSAVEEARHRKAWLPWLHGTFPELVEREEGGAAMLLGRDGHDTGMQGLFRLEELAVMLPQGMALCDVKDAALVRPVALFRFIVRFAPELQRYPLMEAGAASRGAASARSSFAPALVLERA